MFILLLTSHFLVLGAIRAINMGPEASHHLIHIVADEKFDKTDLTFASKWVVGEFAERAWKYEQQQYISMLEKTVGAVKGYVFENVMHGTLAKGGEFDVVPLHLETLERGEEEKLVIQACTEFKTFTHDVAHYMTSTIKNTYLKPKSASFPVIDALKVPEIYFFQMTVSDDKEINADDLEDVFQQLGIPVLGQAGKDMRPSLYFVVDPDKYGKFMVRPAMKKLKSGQDGEERKVVWPPDPKKKEYVLSANTLAHTGGSLRLRLVWAHYSVGEGASACVKHTY
ncbi:hypothetical protein VOLCADRAFT_90794 [Volvox carteri f. nagariensis]|uniref:Uncharacterized protein n=1 Tax=Volvox carteri f. nagariensis TaxID=3068 RepID=D8TV26_VOLCA|nr:uncharacterized protein VOLCADRAFT_90794 [Volvox carteri f. nagariensis]EFJ48628.1 hypothetical protein VOLCADRAFT_90794 [Volvox carteri f. nagariensis]|eukprot:XP_002950427.1 hypothetical protein VOLCADRAFT_90794 [Volvox carteri f. nagariensis]